MLMSLMENLCKHEQSVCSNKQTNKQTYDNDNDEDEDEEDVDDEDDVDHDANAVVDEDANDDGDDEDEGLLYSTNVITHTLKTLLHLNLRLLIKFT